MTDISTLKSENSFGPKHFDQGCNNIETYNRLVPCSRDHVFDVTIGFSILVIFMCLDVFVVVFSKRVAEFIARYAKRIFAVTVAILVTGGLVCGIYYLVDYLMAEEENIDNIEDGLQSPPRQPWHIDRMVQWYICLCTLSN
jgi:hypothetical protein